MTQSFAAPRPDPAPLETPWDRIASGARALMQRTPAHALAARGARHVRAGLLASGGALVGFAIGAFMIGSAWPLIAFSVATTFALTAAGILAGSRLARGIAWLQGVSFAIEGVRFFLHLHRDSAFFAADLVIGTSTLAFAAGVALATLTPAARAWHDLRGATLEAKRKPKTLDEWRR